jgi:hypothetical protein
MAAIKKQKIEKDEGELVETKAETVKEEKNAEAEVKTEYKPTDYEYKSWSCGVPVPDGWERCPGYADVIRRLKVALPKTEDTPAETEARINII